MYVYNVMLNLYVYKSVGTLFNYVLQREFFFIALENNILKYGPVSIL